MPTPTWQIRAAQQSDIPALHALIEASIRGLQADDYTPAQIEGALGTVLGLDTQLIRDQTYFVVEASQSDQLEASDNSPQPLAYPQPERLPTPGRPVLAGCGGWSKRKTLFGSDGASVREPELLNPATDAAKVRAIFVHPDFARRGLGSLILAHVEAAAQAAGFHHFEMGSTLTGVPLYRLKGYVEAERIAVPLPNGEALPIVKMIKPAIQRN
ncbi:MAG TPA: GNAT family N-acetyltransferase [Acidobacteriaceae bacterium]|jgi:GNAT superfamily N-acetyltransferase|nr:GNAT family N-acetyltransferase [Acidobacteriaceae bacterium]